MGLDGGPVCAYSRTFKTGYLFSHSLDGSVCSRMKYNQVILPSRLTTPVFVAQRSTLRKCLLSAGLYSVSSSPFVLFTCYGGSEKVSLIVGNRGSLLHSVTQCLKGGIGVRSMAMESSGVLEGLIVTKNSINPIVLYSKTWCPYCSTVKSLFRKLGVVYVTVELDELVDEQEVQETLQTLTGQSTVPNVFIGGRHVGGCDETMALHQKGDLLPLIISAGAKFSTT